MSALPRAARGRAFIAILIVLILTPLIPDRTQAHPATECGTWSVETSGRGDRVDVVLTETVDAECTAQLQLTNTSRNLGALGGSGYQVDLGDVDGARAGWRAGLAVVQGDSGYLTHAVSADLGLSPTDPSSPASLMLEVSVTTGSMDHDASFFLLAAVLRLAGEHDTCQVSAATLAEIAMHGSLEIGDVSALAREFRYEAVLLTLNRTLPAYLEGVADAAGDVGNDCFEQRLADVVAMLDEAGGLVFVTRLGLELVTTLGKAAWDSLHAGAAPVVITLRYTPAAPDDASVSDPTPTSESTQTPETPSIPSPVETQLPDAQAIAISGEIAYVPYGQGEIWLRDLRSGASEQLTSGHEPWYSNVQLTPDGRSLLYVNSPVNLGDLYLRSLDGGGELAIDTGVQCATVSPDGSTAAYAVLPSDDSSGERVAIWMFDLVTYQYRLAYELASADLVALLGVDATTGAAVRAFTPEENQQGCGLAWSAGGWLYISLALDMQDQCGPDCAGLPVTFRMNNGAVEVVSAPVSPPNLDGLPQSLEPIAGSLCLGAPTASLDGALAFTRCRTPYGSSILLWDVAGGWYDVAPGTASTLNSVGDLLFVEQDGSLDCGGQPCPAGTVIYATATLEPLQGRIDGVRVAYRGPE